MKYIKRFLALPFIAVLTAISAIFLFTKTMYNYIVYGGEFITYKKGDAATMRDIYKVLKDIKEEEKNEQMDNK